MNFLKSFSIYTFASIIEKGIAFFLLPIFTFYLSTKDFGVLALITSIISFGLPLVTLGVQGAVSVAYFKGNRENYPSYFTSAIIPPFFVALFLILIIIIFQVPIENYLEVPIAWVMFIPLFCFLSFFNSSLLIDYQIKDQPTNYITFSLAGSILNIVFSLILVIIYKFGYQGRLLGQYASVCIFSVIAGYILYKKRKLLVRDVSWINIKDSLIFGLPLIPHIIGSLIINMSDRLFIDYFQGKEQLGIYNLAYVLGSAISILCAAFANAIIPFSYELFERNTYEAKLKVVKVYWMFIGLLIIAVFLVWLITPYIFMWFIDPKFATGIEFVIWITIGYFFQGMYLLFANIIFYLKKTKILFYLSFINVIINIGLNYYLISTFGTIGAAYATCISFVVFFITIAIYCHKLYPLPWLGFILKEKKL
ncbi:O-antigen/teichoic acid export membrane protein [Flavobacterium chryseum]|uniref:oligosaccharide flippase family protein n=1 Tax=Flavobacterium sp. P3160 TaxID=2512113 RepID=UPI00105D4BC3|nr:oligosaccharide flippase family protein [Flavobacterium sp. P3160]TDO77437.1 O-antigen/teichoic acid export membrane protein [Flavobacterium sp. P3160]